MAAQLLDGNARAASEHLHHQNVWEFLKHLSEKASPGLNVFILLHFQDDHLIFVPKLVAGTTKPPQKGVKRENPLLYRACQLRPHRKYRSTKTYEHRNTENTIYILCHQLFHRNMKKLPCCSDCVCTAKC